MDFEIEKFGYGRVSISKQVLNRQINMFKELGIKKTLSILTHSID